MTKYPMQRLGSVLSPTTETITVQPDGIYNVAGILGYGRGLLRRPSVVGSDMSYRMLTPIRSNQIVFGRLNAWEGGITVTTSQDAGLLVSQEFPVLTIDQGKALPAYLAHICRWPDFWEQLWSRARGLGARSGARRLRVHQDQLCEVEIPLPSLDEQRRLADYLDGARLRLQRVTELSARVSQLASALPDCEMNWFESSHPLYPTRLGDVLEQVQVPVEIDPTAIYRSIGVRSFGKGIFHYPPRPGSDIGKLRFFDVQANHLVVSNIKGWEGAVAMSSASDMGSVASNRFLFFRPRNDLSDVRYLSRKLLTGDGLAALGKASPGSADRNRTLAVQRFEEIQLQLPDADAQRSVGEELTRLDGLLERRRQILARTDAVQAAVFPSLLGQAFSGNL